MNSIFIKVFFLFFIFSINVSLASEQASEKAADSTLPDKSISTGETYLENFLANTKTLQASFKQTLRSYNGEVLQQTNGQFYLHRPGKFRWNYVAPYEQEIVSDGERIWIYDVDLEQVTVQKQVEGLSATPMALLENGKTLHESFKVVELDNKAGIYRLKLLSKNADSDFGEIVVGLDKTGLRFLQLHDQFEQVTDIVFDDLQLNTKLASDLFQFKPPQGVDVFGGF